MAQVVGNQVGGGGAGQEGGGAGQVEVAAVAEALPPPAPLQGSRSTSSSSDGAKPKVTRTYTKPHPILSDPRLQKHLTKTPSETQVKFSRDTDDIVSVSQATSPLYHVPVPQRQDLDHECFGTSTGTYKTFGMCQFNWIVHFDAEGEQFGFVGSLDQTTNGFHHLDEDEGKYLYVLHPEGGDSEVPNYPRVCLMLPGDVPEGEAWVQVKATDPDWDVSAE